MAAKFDTEALLSRADGGLRRLAIRGEWTAARAGAVEATLAKTEGAVREAGPLVIDGSGTGRLDTLGALALVTLQRRAEAAGAKVAREGFTPAHAELLDRIFEAEPVAPAARREGGAFDVLADIGEGTVEAGKDVLLWVSFLGKLMVAMARALTGIGRFRMASVVTQLERVGLRSVPIIVLISSLVGAIIAQQSIFQLRTFGTVQFVADLLGILVLRELAVLLTAIMIAGRSGSSFTAELGSMKMREEIDALQTMGLDPMEVLVVPRVLALMIALPLLTFISAMAGLAGGGLVALTYGGMSLDVFLGRLQVAISINTVLVGLVKAPVMAVVIGLIACIEGLAVRGSAESLGKHTTASVVKAIFVVIVVDGVFAMFFAAIRV